MRTLLFAALSKYESHLAGLALGIYLIVVGASLLARGEKVNVGSYRGRIIRGRTVRCIGMLEIVLGLFVAEVLSRWGTCSRCRTDRSVLDLWLVMLAVVLGLALRRIWSRRRS